MELTGSWDWSVLMFCGRAKVTLGGAKAAADKKCNSHGQKWRSGCILTRAEEPKMEIPDQA
jgi:hypothetical protein